MTKIRQKISQLKEVKHSIQFHRSHESHNYNSRTEAVVFRTLPLVNIVISVLNVADGGR